MTKSNLHMQITDRATALGADSFGKDIQVRISGFYKIGQRAPGNKVLLACHCNDPELAVIGSTSGCGLFHRPWELIWNGFISWDADHIQNERNDWAEKVSKGDHDYVHGITSNSYPQIFERFPELSAHQKLRIEQWRADTAALIQAEIQKTSIVPG